MGNAITPLSPSNAGGPVPAKAYALTTTLAGKSAFGSNDGMSGANSSFSIPYGVVVDPTNTYLYVADALNNKIRRITISTGATTTLAGELNNNSGNLNGNRGYNSSFNSPLGVAVDPTNTYIYVSDNNNDLVRRVTISTGETTTLAGSTTNPIFSNLLGIVVDPSNTYVYVSNIDNNNIIRITIASGATKIFAGDPKGTYGSYDGTGPTALFYDPRGLAIDTSNTYMYVADTDNNLIRRITISTGAVTTIAGDPSTNNGSTNGNSGTTSSFNAPGDVIIDPTNTYLYVADIDNNLIRRVTIATGATTTLVGNLAAGNSNGTGSSVSLNSATNVGIDASGNLYVSDLNNNLIRTVELFGYSAISPTLPAGLSFDSTTGIISGTPTAVSPATIYTTTAYNSLGNSTATTSIAVTQTLPVTLASFTGMANGCTAHLAWHTTSESNSGYYALEYGTDGSFNQVKTVPSQNSSTGAEYTAEYALGSGNNFFRLKEVDNDGQFTYSAVVTVMGTGTCGAGQQVTAWPNPTNGVVNLHALTLGSTISLYNIKGQKLIVAVAKDANQSIDLGKFPKGIYTLSIQLANGSVSTTKVEKQ